MEVVYKDHNSTEVLCNDRNMYSVYTGSVDTNNLSLLGKLEFQKGSPEENGINGLNNEHLLAALVHRIEQQNSKFACSYNEQALFHINEALECLENRTKDRVSREVEGQEKE